MPLTDRLRLLTMFERRRVHRDRARVNIGTANRDADIVIDDFDDSGRNRAPVLEIQSSSVGTTVCRGSVKDKVAPKPQLAEWGK